MQLDFAGIWKECLALAPVRVSANCRRRLMARRRRAARSTVLKRGRRSPAGGGAWREPSAAPDLISLYSTSEVRNAA